MCNAQRIEELFQKLIELSTAAEREEYLDRVCGDDSGLRHRLEALVRSHEEAGSFLGEEDAGKCEPTVDQGPRIPESQRIGAYKLRELIGEGGMGSVYVAEQEKPLRRKVALKVIKPGMDSKLVLGRFEAERNALALMNHPNIAKVLDAGETEQGRPFFVMELVNGIPITQYCDDQKLTIRQRLELFTDVCQAIQHAHQKGIIHRDIKPSNVLVTELDGKPIAKVIDFGVAKALNKSLTEHSVYTAFQTIIGTPLYMSPEQASFSAVDVDTRSDVYSLGVLLYELLTGTTPFTNDDLKNAAQDEVFRFIRECEPPRPSNRISSLGDTAARVSQLRRTEPNQLGRIVKGDLDWIVMKALAKERSRRYDAPSRLAEDVSRYLNNELVEARSPSVLYQLRKFYARNKAFARSTAAVFLALSFGLGITLWSYQQIKDKNRTLADQQRALQDALDRETTTADMYRDELFEKLILRLFSGDPNFKELVDEAIASDMSRDRVNLLRAQAAIYSGHPDAAQGHLQNILQRDPDNVPANALLAMSYFYAGQLWKSVPQRDRASSLTPRNHLDRIFLATCALGIDPRGREHVNTYLDEQKTPLGFAVRAALTGWGALGDNRNAQIKEALDDIHVARKFLGPTAFVLQTELQVNIQAYGTAEKDDEMRGQYLSQAKAAAEELGELFPDYFWGNCQRGSLWYAIGDFERAANIWRNGSNDWSKFNLAFALQRNENTGEARKTAESIDSAFWRLLCYPILMQYERGREITQDAYKEVINLAETEQVYREPCILVVLALLGEPTEAMRQQAQAWLDSWETDVPTGSYRIWKRECVRYFANVYTKNDLMRVVQGNPVGKLELHCLFGLRALAENDTEVAANEFAQGFDPDWESTFIGSMFSACLLQELNQQRNANLNKNRREDHAESTTTAETEKSPTRRADPHDE